MLVEFPRFKPRFKSSHLLVFFSMGPWHALRFETGILHLRLRLEMTRALRQGPRKLIWQPNVLHVRNRMQMHCFEIHSAGKMGFNGWEHAKTITENLQCALNAGACFLKSDSSRFDGPIARAESLKRLIQKQPAPMSYSPG